MEHTEFNQCKGIIAIDNFPKGHLICNYVGILIPKTCTDVDTAEWDSRYIIGYKLPNLPKYDPLRVYRIDGKYHTHYKNNYICTFGPGINSSSSSSANCKLAEEEIYIDEYNNLIWGIIPLYTTKFISSGEFLSFSYNLKGTQGIKQPPYKVNEQLKIISSLVRQELNYCKYVKGWQIK